MATTKQRQEPCGASSNLTCPKCNGTGEPLEDLSKLADSGELDLVNDPVVRRCGLMYEVLDVYRAERAQGASHDLAYFRACYAWDV